MACLDKSSSSSTSEYMKNNNMCPRISFSDDFAESQYLQVMRNPREKCPPPASVDFEFSVSNNNYNMLTTADELFFKGQLLPFKAISHKTTTLREELLVEEDHHDLQQVSHRPPKSSSTRWMSLLGLKKSHIAPKKTSPTLDFTGTVE